MISRRSLLKSLAFLPFTVKKAPWSGDPIGTIVRNPSNIIFTKLGDIKENRAGHKWVRKFGTIPYPRGSPYHGHCDYYWERVE